MSEHASALEAAMKAGGFDSLDHVARKAVEDAIAAYLSERAAEAVGVVCLGCGSNWTEDRLKEEREKRPELISCCPERKTIPVFAAPPAEANAEIERLREALRPMQSIARAILAEAPVTSNRYNMFTDCEGDPNWISLEELRAIEALDDTGDSNG